jgi:hypothetical protein
VAGPSPVGSVPARPPGRGPPSPAGGHPAVTIHYRDRRRALAGILLVLAALLLISSLGGPWWQLSLLTTNVSSGQAGQVQSSEVIFSLWGPVTCALTNWGSHNPCNVVSSEPSGFVGALDTGLGLLFAGLAAIGLAGATFAILAGAGVARGRWQLVLALLFAIAVAAGAVGGCLGAAAIGPGAQANSYCYNWSVNATQCGLFWGSAAVSPYPLACTVCANELSWGASNAWYFSLVAGFLGAIGAYLLWVGRKGPLTKAEVTAWAAQRGYVRTAPPPSSAPAGPGPPPPRLESLPAGAVGTKSAFAESPTRRTSWKCPRCGVSNAPWAAACGRCGFEITTDRGPPPGSDTR